VKQWTHQQLKTYTFYSNTLPDEKSPIDNRQFLLPWEGGREYMKHERNLSAKIKKGREKEKKKHK
jgi:hypothetical protein